MQDKIWEKLKKDLIGIEKNVSLKNYTTYKIGGPAKYFFVAKNKENLINAVKIAKALKLSVFIMGGGSNLLIADKGFNGLVIKIDITGVEFKDNKLFVGAGEKLAKLSYLTADQGLSGLEWAAGIPGAEIGGSIYGHAQAFGDKISDNIESVQVIDAKTLRFKNFTKKQCQFSLKNSSFKKNRNLIIVSAVLVFGSGEKEEIRNKIKEFLDYRRSKHPVIFPSAGSAFVNPEKKITNKKLLEKFPELKEFNIKGVIPAGYLINKSGLSGKKIGNAQISEKHSNFIINIGGAKAKDVLALINLAKKKVKNNFGISLEPEVQFVGFSK
ncbi:MAG: UDP-N-acetylmuramate dehydrogenase [Candidatus Staskawiczbacteria bacterium]|jgi:UDP-N-acetylmuramate dehydrogenase